MMTPGSTRAAETDAATSTRGEPLRVQTVLGPIPPERLGCTLVHEHIAIDLSSQKGDPDTALPDASCMIPEVAEFVGAGGGAIVDQSNIGMGRSVERLRAVSAATGCHVVAGTGFYQQAYHPWWVSRMSAGELAAIMVKEIVHGVGDTGIAAGIIGEIGTSRGEVHPEEEKVLRAAAMAHRFTGAPIGTHCTLGALGLKQLDILESEGVEPCRVGVGHLDLADDVEYHSEIARRGAFVQYDTVGKAAYQPDEVRVRFVLEMLDRGYLRNILLSSDITRRSHLRSGGGRGYACVLTSFLPRLRAAGVGEAELKVIMVDNPARYLAFKRS